VRLLQLIDQLGRGGAEMLQLTFASGLDHTRFELHIAALRPRSDVTIVPELRALGLPVTEFNLQSTYDLRALREITAYLRRHRIDIIHTHLPGADIVGRLAGFRTRRPVVSTIHNVLADFAIEPRRRRVLERLTAHLWCRKLVVVSDLFRREIADWFGFPLARVPAIPNGVDTGRFARGPDFDRAAVKQALVGSSGPLITSVARLYPQKAQHHLIRAARIVLDARPDVRVALVGDGPLREPLQAQINDLGLADKIILTGFRPDIPDILAASDLFTLSSAWEGMPVSLLEAMAAGCTAIATEVGGVAQVVTPGATGLLVPPGDPPALAAALLRCLDDPPYARQLAAAGRAWVIQEYGMRAWVAKWERLYLQELGATRQPRRGDRK
jgi:glycosyltransferase involved in cell wall biosynthesis